MSESLDETPTEASPEAVDVVSEHDASEDAAAIRAQLEAVRPQVEAVLCEYLGLDGPAALLWDGDGDIPIRLDNALYFVRLLERDPVLVRVFSFILRDVELSPGLLEVLNAINSDIVAARIFWYEGSVIAATEIPASSVDVTGLAHSCWSVGTLASWSSPELHDAFGGTLPPVPDVEGH